MIQQIKDDPIFLQFNLYLVTWKKFTFVATHYRSHDIHLGGYYSCNQISANFDKVTWQIIISISFKTVDMKLKTI